MVALADGSMLSSVFQNCCNLSVKMPLYELFCLAQPRLSKPLLSQMIKAVSRTILEHNGVLTDIKSFGERQLAYDIRKAGGKVTEAAMWQVTFAADTKVLPDIDHILRVDERVLRWIFVKKKPFDVLPNPYKIAQAAEGVAKELQQ